MLVQFFLWFSFFVSLSVIFLESVLLVGVFGLFFSLMICYLVSFFFSSWFSAIVVIVYVGGLLVMFSYFLAVCPNEVVGSKWWAMGVSFFGACSLVFFSGHVYFSPSMVMKISAIETMYVSENSGVLIFLVGVLLFCLFSVVSVVGLSQGPLRPFGGES